jgi:hypothetical protein
MSYTLTLYHTINSREAEMQDIVTPRLYEF